MIPLTVLLPLLGCGYGLSSASDVPEQEDDAPGYNLCGAPGETRADGTWRKPVVMDSWPFVDRGDTSLAETRDASLWDCGTVPRAGAEIVYRVKVPAGAQLRAELVADEGVNVTMQLTRERPGNGAVVGCVAVDPALLEVGDPEPGTWYLVVDTPSPEEGERPGAYTLLVDLYTPGAWQERELGDGLLWSRFLGSDATVRQAYNVFTIDTTSRRVRPRPHYECQSVPARVAELTDPVVGLALGASDGTCTSGGFQSGPEYFRMDDETIRVNNYADNVRAVGWSDGQDAQVRSILRGNDWTEVQNGFAGFPQLVSAGVVAIDPQGTEPLYSDARARTAAGLSARGELMLVTVDGPHARAHGLSLDGFANMLVEAGAEEAVNLGGAEAVTAWVDGCSLDGVVNWPLYGGGTSRSGAQPVSAGVYVF